jgi:hypothetical protein
MSIVEGFKKLMSPNGNETIFFMIEEMLAIFLKVRNRERDMLKRLFLVVTNELVTIDLRNHMN